MRREQHHLQYELERELDRRIEEETETMAIMKSDCIEVSFVAEAGDFITCDVCLRNEVSPLFENENTLLSMYLVSEENRPGYELYACEDCLEMVLEDW